MEYRYSNDHPTHANHYLWPYLQRILARRRPPARVLEIGCGNGATSRMLAEMGYSVIGVDPSRSGIELAKRHERPSLQFELGSVDDDLAKRYGTFPLVVSLEVIEHCTSPQVFIDTLWSALEPGGLGILSTPYHSYLKNLLIVASGRFDRHFDPLWEGGHIKFFSVPKLRTLCARFSRVEFYRIGRVPLVAKSVMVVATR